MENEDAQALADEVLRQETAIVEGRAVDVGGYLFPAVRATTELSGPTQKKRTGNAAVDELVPWLRQRIRERLYLATHTMELGNAAEWTELSSGVLMTCRPDSPQDDPHDRWEGVWPMGDSSLTRLMEANDPRDTINRCESELAMLDLCERVIREDEHAHDDCGAAASWTGFAVARLNLRLMASGYRHRKGYREEWGACLS